MNKKGEVRFNTLGLLFYIYMPVWCNWQAHAA